jgi:hypothetical protein
MEAAYMVWKLNTTHRSAAQNLYIWSQEHWQLLPSLFCCFIGGMPLTRAIMSFWSRQEGTELNHQPGFGTYDLPRVHDCAALPRSMQPMQPIQGVQPMHAMRMTSANHAGMSASAIQMPYMYGNTGATPLGWFMPVGPNVARLDRAHSLQWH